MSAKEPDQIKGVVIAKTNRASDTAIRLLNVEFGTKIERRVLLYGPQIKKVTILQKAFIHKGRKRVKRSKLYYLRDRNPSQFHVK